MVCKGELAQVVVRVPGMTYVLRGPRVALAEQLQQLRRDMEDGSFLLVPGWEAQPADAVHMAPGGEWAEPVPDAALTGEWLAGYGGGLRVYRGLLLRVNANRALVCDLNGCVVWAGDRWTDEEYKANGGTPWTHAKAEQLADEYLAREWLGTRYPRLSGGKPSRRRTEVTIDRVLREKPRPVPAADFIPYTQRRVLDELKDGAVLLSKLPHMASVFGLVERGLVHVYRENEVWMACRVAKEATVDV